MRAVVQSEEAGIVVIAHDGFRRMSGLGEHVRRLRVQTDAVTVEDRVEGAGAATLEISWVFAPGWAPASDVATPTLRSDQTVVACVVLDETGRPLGPRWEGYEQSRRYGQRQTAFRVSFRISVVLPTSVTTTITVQPCVE